jgi:chromosome segregation ATPase
MVKIDFENPSVKGRITVLRKCNNEELVKTVLSKETLVKNQSKRINRLNDTIIDQHKRILNLLEDKAKLENTIKTINNNNANNANRCAMLATKYNNACATIKSLERKISGYKKDIKSSNKDLNESATQMRNAIDTIKSKDKLIFEKNNQIYYLRIYNRCFMVIIALGIIGIILKYLIFS